jgi:hypothetical protein
MSKKDPIDDMIESMEKNKVIDRSVVEFIYDRYNKYGIMIEMLASIGIVDTRKNKDKSYLFN